VIDLGELAKIIGDRIRNFRIEKGFSQEYLGELSELHRTYIGEIERGEANATIESLEKVASALGITIQQLFRYSEASDGGTRDFTLAQIVSRLQVRSINDQKIILKLIDIMLDWNDNASKL
jgi:transcriptional regulator with XRE-family HTH domain